MMKPALKYCLVVIPASLLILSSCKNDPLDVDVSSVNTQPIKVQRLEQDVFSLNAGNMDKKTNEILQKYGPLYNHYLLNPFGIRGTTDTNYKSQVLDFITDRDVRAAYKGTQALYGDLSAIENGVNLMVKRFKYHFPERKVPHRLVTLTSGWNYAFAYMDSALVISLDMYLGDTSMFYQMLRYPQYQARKMNRLHILPDIARGWLLTEFDNSMSENTLLNHTIFYGKLFYTVNALLPDHADSLIIGYSAEQIKTANKYEKEYWSYMAEKNRLFENSLTTVRELTTDGPFTAAIGKECPPRIAMWLGWQIVKSYMKNNEEVSLQQLMSEKDAQKILNKSKYRP